jgi:ribonuclease HI
MGQAAALTINIDGAARGNPGPAAYAYVIVRDGHAVLEEAGCLGTATNNVAEYTALVKALERAAELGGKRVLIRSDSELLVKQMSGEYRVKNDQLRELYNDAQQLSKQFDNVSIRHVPRSENGEADRLCNEALDGTKKRDVPRKTQSTKKPWREALVREDAVCCLRDAARAWSNGDPAAPSPEQVWDQLWSILEENGIG